jgi:septal ring-binding cell division protein DamX
MNDRQRFGAIVLSILLVAAGGFSALSAAGGGTGGVEGETDSEASECEAFSEPIVLSAAGLTISVGPPMDLGGDGVCEDFNGDGESTVLDAALHAVAATAVDAGEFDLSGEQANAVDVDRDGDVDYEDALALAQTAFTTDGDSENGADEGEEDSETTTEEEPETTADAAEATATDEETAEEQVTAEETTTEEETTEETTTEAETTDEPAETETDEPTDTATETADDSTAPLAITEIQADAPGEERENLNGEFVTITNTGEEDVDLTDYTVTFGDGQEYTFESVTLDAGDSVTVHVGSGDDTDSDVYAGYEAPVLNNDDPDTVTLIDADGDELDSES